MTATDRVFQGKKSYGSDASCAEQAFFFFKEISRFLNEFYFIRM
ncbi:hypothetical protein JNUCC74_17645 [Cerasibacillus sp. JNUCC 74]